MHTTPVKIAPSRAEILKLRGLNPVLDAALELWAEEIITFEEAMRIVVNFAIPMLREHEQFLAHKLTPKIDEILESKTN